MAHEAMHNSSDGELVCRARGGERAAFDVLVLRYRQAVLGQAYALLHDWEAAEDAAQQALLEAYAGLSGLQDAGKFRGWLLTILQRCAYRAYRRAPADAEFTETVIYPAALPPTPPDDLVESIRAGLAELSARRRAVVTWHYLDGLSVREIAGRLGSPEGTVKRILHESRNQLRAAAGVSPRKGADMSNTTKDTVPRTLVWWINGDRGPGSLLGSSLAHTVCLAINKEAKTTERIAKEVQAHPRYVR